MDGYRSHKSSHPDYPRRSACVPGSRDGRAGDPVGPGDRHQLAHGWDDRAAGRREGADQRVRASAKHMGVQIRTRGCPPARLAAVPAGALDRHRIVLFSLWFLIFAALVASPDPAMAQGTVTVTSVTSEAWDDPDLAADEEGARLLVHHPSYQYCLLYRQRHRRVNFRERRRHGPLDNQDNTCLRYSGIYVL